ncbi:PAS domain S-box protein [Neobacillus dielmonensis]|uniref:PAS domain S-box protein n=1 Tax=Neobacillus dielmonensis TaxID=1347369 RepID=UPI001F3DEEF8|nr:PAS domain S-box protein [Neobacillus dielmonensis]
MNGVDRDNQHLLDELERVKRENEQLKLQLTASKAASTHLDDSEKKFEHLFNSISDAIYYLKIEEDGIVGNFIEVNRAAHSRLGYTREEAMNLSPFDIDYHEKDEIVDLLKMIKNNQSLTFETVHKCKDGSRIPVEVNTHLLEIEGENYTLSVCRDISNRKRSEKEIRETKDQYQRLVESSTNGIVVIQDDKWVFANRAALELFGAESKEQLLGRSIYDMLSPRFIEEYNRLKEYGEEDSKFRFNWKILNGREIYTEAVLIPSIFKEKVAKQLIIQDVTERKRAEDLKIQAEKMNVVAQIAAGIAHEIRNPLTSLKGFVQLFREDTVPNKEILKIMENELERINDISSEFLTLAKPYNLDFVELDIKELVKNVVNLLEKEASRRSVTFQTFFTQEKVTVSGVGTELKKVFLNLIKNAIEVMPNGGNIGLFVESHDGIVSVSIQDNGAGLTEEQLSHLGEPFYTTKETGTGLGLMVTYQIIKTHNGEIDVKSKLNEGTTFIVKLPAVNEG